MLVDIRDIITCLKFGDDRFRGLASAEGQILPFPIDFDGRPYNTLTLPCERVICMVFNPRGGARESLSAPRLRLSTKFCTSHSVFQHTIFNQDRIIFN